MKQKQEAKLLRKVAKEHEKVETKAQEAKESKSLQSLERKLGVEKHKKALLSRKKE